MVKSTEKKHARTLNKKKSTKENESPRKKFRIRIDSRIRIPSGAYAVCLFMFLGMAGMVYSQAATQGARMRLSVLRTQLAETRAHSQAIYTELYENYDKEEIERIAIEELNMRKRAPHQEVRVSVPKASYIVSNKPKAEAAPKMGLLDSIINFIFR